jgi:two-component system, NarL family, response regulator LiaR
VGVLGGDTTLRILLAEADPGVRRAIRSALTSRGAVVVAEAGTGREALSMIAYYEPEVALLEHAPPRLDALATIRDAAAAGCPTRIIVLADEEDEDLALAALRAGAVGQLPRDVSGEALARAVRSACEGEAVVSRRLTARLVEHFRAVPKAGAGLRPVRSQLTDREWEVLDLLARGATTEEIARTLVLSTETVRSHLKNLYRKLGVRSRDEATAAAARLREHSELPA